MIIYGASGHGKVVAAAAQSQGIEVVGFFDDRNSGDHFLGMNLFGKYDPTVFSKEEIVIGIGDNKIRRRISENVDHHFGVVCHTSANRDESIVLGDGTVVMMGASIQVDVIVGKHAILNTGASVDHDCRIDDFVHISPNAVLCGAVTIGELTQVGANAVILPNLRIGKNCVVGAGAVVTKNIPDNSVVIGNPAKIIRENG